MSMSPPDRQSFFDRLTDIDDILRTVRDELKKLNDKVGTGGGGVSFPTGIFEDILAELENISGRRLDNRLNVSIGSVDEPVDLTSSEFSTGRKDTFGDKQLQGEIVDDGGNTFDIILEWQREDGTLQIREERSSLTNISTATLNGLAIRGAYLNLRIKDNGGANSVHGTVVSAS